VPCARWHRRHSVAAAVSVPTASELSHCCLCLHALPIRIPRQTARQEGSFKRKQGGDLGDRSTPSRPCSPRQSLGSEHPVFATSKCRVSRYWFRSTAGKAHACSHAPHMPAALQIYPDLKGGGASERDPAAFRVTHAPAPKQQAMTIDEAAACSFVCFAGGRS
jgi:hypothetical protein